MFEKIGTYIFEQRKTLYVHVFLILLLSTYYLFLKCRRDPRLMAFAKTIDGPDGLPLVGNSLQFAFGGLDAFVKTCAAYSEKYGSVYKLWLGRELVISLSEISHLKVILTSSKTLGKPKNLFGGFEDFWGNSLFTIPVPMWRQTRKKLQPAFGRNVMKYQIPSINKSIDMIMKLFENHLNGPEFNVYEYAPYLVAHAFLSSFVGVNLSFKETKHFSFHTILNEVGKESLRKLIRPWKRVNFISKLCGGDRAEIQEYRKTLHEFFGFITGKTSTLGKDDWFKESEDPENITVSLLNMTQGLEKELNLENYSFYETMGIISASTDTTSTILSYCLLMIAIHPDIQNRLCEEICQVLGVNGIPATMEDLDECKYLDQVLKETMRRFTVVPNIFRYTDEDIEVGSMVIPAGVAVMVRITDVHMNPRIYPNPEKFNPENFSPEAVSQRSKCSFLAFSTGSRDCIGKIFAESTIKLSLIAILQNFKLSSTTKMEEIEYDAGFIVTKRGGYWLSITPRN